MLFNIEQDTGDELIFYLVPDDFSSNARCRVSSAGDVIGVFDANEERRALVAAGRHETGMCGFRLNTSHIPGMSTVQDLSIFDNRTGVTIYARPGNGRVQRRILRLETHLLPLWRFDELLKPNFQYFEAGIDRHGRETVTQMFLLNQCDSVYLSGRILFRNYAYYVDKGFDTLVVIQAPHAELVERLRILALVNSIGGAHLGERDQSRLSPAIEFAASLDFQDAETFVRRLRQMPGPVELLLAEPLTRQLTSAAPDDMPVKGAVARALEILAGCRLIGFRDASLEFVTGLSEFLQRPLPDHLSAAIPVFDSIQPLAAKLRDTRILDHLIDRDLDIFDQVRQAHEAAHTD